MGKRRRRRVVKAKGAYPKSYSRRYDPFWNKIARDVPFNYDEEYSHLHLQERETTWKSDFHQGIRQWYTVHITKGRYSKLDMKFSQNDYFFEYFEFLPDRTIKKISAIYHGRDIAMLKCEHQTSIDWIEMFEELRGLDQ